MLPAPLRIALQLLTRFPVRGVASDWEAAAAKSMCWYPAVGLIIGFLLWVVAQLTVTFPASLQAVLVLITWVAITGGLHLDGLADSADGWIGGHGKRSRTLAIMRDSHVGVIAVVVLVLVLLLKFTALQALLSGDDYFVLIWAPIVARSAALLLFRYTDYVREQGIANALLEQLPMQPIAPLVGLITGLLVVTMGGTGLWILFAVTLLLLGLRQWMIKHLGGCTGDTTGALIELTEVTVLVVALI
ncbi:MAG: adenosylcobinamide-GDP ribazoletransferase [Gammaproteobacteria bacterium]|nr:MAG: adenosylcobinamide-GDP ribazoletransferase [Gammaproteobacteria bacterium]